MKIYVASSWRNEQQQEVVKQLREDGHEVYDFKNPTNGDKGFAWSDIDPDWQNWTNEQYHEALKHPVAIKAFENDFNAMKESDVCVMVMPCGRSAHVEAGWMKGNGKATIVLQEKESEPELMYKCFDKVVENMEEVLTWLDAREFIKVITSNETFVADLFNEAYQFGMFSDQMGYAKQMLFDLRTQKNNTKTETPFELTKTVTN